MIQRLLAPDVMLRLAAAARLRVALAGMLCVVTLDAGCHAAHTRVRVEPHTVPDRVVVLTFDDAVRSHYETVAPMLRRYGFGATFFVTEFQQPPFSDTTSYMTWAQIGALAGMGFEIGNHTWKHTHVDRMDRAHFVEELRYIEARARAIGAPTPASFAYPAYVTSPEAVRTLRDVGYRFARIGGDRAYDPARDDPLLIPSFTTGAANRSAILAAFEQARDGKIVVLTIHGVPDTAHPWVTTPVALFEEYLRYLHDNHFHVIAMRDLGRYVPAAHSDRVRNSNAPTP
jgi:peptidoglycan/xylan/chitin deacetylase (PgdA/CDA1 family)